MFGKTISLFLIEGDPNSRWVCELSNWKGKAYKIPRIKVRSCNDRLDLSACGIYFLFGKNDLDEKGIVYIGEVENVYARLLQHDSPNGRDFWNECIVFISKDNRLTKRISSIWNINVICLQKKQIVIQLIIQLFLRMRH